jgi:hypothetical protein
MRQAARKTALGIAFGVTVLSSFVARPSSAALDLPGENPVARISQQIGVTQIVVEYSSPAVQGRRIWGALVPYDHPWEPSPDQPTTVGFSADVLIGDKTVPSGSYRFSALPGRGSWTIVLSPYAPVATGMANGPESKANGEPIRFKVPAKAAPFRERLAFLFSNFDAEKTSLDLEWEKLRVSIPITAHTAQQVLSEIKQLDDVWRSYANAARFMLETEKNFDAGLKYADQSLALKQDWYTYWVKAALLAAKHDYQAAVDQGQRASDLGRRQLGERFVLEHDLERTLAEWKRRAPPLSPPAR